ncbi:hypothetical protein Sta7437_4541 (plasmid) [Stanieria cyanosphaera PCC 7437]|uniref:DUF7878 domain-containing protein n=1 Tax=Stanieria cyanosphaera (strain ATCC 29371 / PCC 7437) TaxID=111780 RepID=K9XZP4_STAC7|nr:hypothetical protein [Stanieria cyanosphaera]AFZ38003.1 hypothetical protein Sta7437_4541 [Stanieria cyanosphaera PCC 7437]
MERFSSKHKLEIVFNIVSVPFCLEGAKTVADIEGNLIVYIKKRIFLKEEDILLLEFAIILNRWLQNIQNHEIKNFYYESMNYEEQPILEFVKIDEKKWNLQSVWEEFKNDEYVDFNELLTAATNYITKLKHELKQEFNLDVCDLMK